MPRTKSDYDPAPFQKLLQQLLDESGESFREASAAAGLSPTTLSNYMRGSRPMRDACIALADHFDVDPNDLLRAAGYEPLRIFERIKLNPSDLPPDVAQLAAEIMKIEDEVKRKAMSEALSQALRIQREVGLEEALAEIGSKIPGSSVSANTKASG
jgi:transcriptional regulator with XRE-family HTH domain